MQPPPPPEGWIRMVDPRAEYIPVPSVHRSPVRIASSPNATATKLQDGGEERQTNPSQPSWNPNPDLYPPVRSWDYAPAEANKRFETETSRAIAPERSALEYSSRLKSTTETKDRSDQEAARLRNELKLYKLQLENAQKEIFRAQDIINQVSALRNEAEADAARAWTKARKLQEEKLTMLAREEGRQEGYQEGYQEGLSKGRRMGFQEARSLREPEESLQSLSRRFALSDDTTDANEQVPEATEAERPGPPQPRWRAPDWRSQQYVISNAMPIAHTYVGPVRL